MMSPGMIGPVMEVPGEQARQLSIGLMRDTTLSTKPWKEAVMTLMRTVAAVRPNQPGAVNLNVVYQIGGELIEPEFSGVRTGTYRKRDRHLMVQVGIPYAEALAAAPDAMATVKARLLEAVDEVEKWARRRGISTDVESLRAIAREALSRV